jgi:hypothetical protein
MPPTPAVPKEGPFFVHVRSRKLYFVHGTAFDATNKREGDTIVLYSPCYESRIPLFARSKGEFFGQDAKTGEARFLPVGSLDDAIAAGLAKADEKDVIMERCKR